MAECRPWVRHHSDVVFDTSRLQVQRDQVTRPDGTAGVYEWVAAADLVRVAAIVDSHVLLVDQYHYLLSGWMLQLPGGSIDPGEDGLAAARRELAEETGYQGGGWTSYGQTYPLPGLTPTTVHLWMAENLDPGQATPEGSEADLHVRHLQLGKAVEAVADGRIGCAVSAALILAVAAHS
jgi:ADP-ribose pyrophosphatase